jgi:hypothetical protein
MGSAAIASLIAHIAFRALLLYGWVWAELGPRSIVVFILLWLTGLYGLPYVPYGASLFSSFVALLDVALVCMIFKGDIRLM